MNIDQQFAQVLAIDDLIQVISKLPRRDNIFAGKMLAAFNYYGHLTDRQFEIVKEILARHATKGQE